MGNPAENGSNDFGLLVGFVVRVLARLGVHDFHPVAQFSLQPTAQFQPSSMKRRPIKAFLVIVPLEIGRPLTELPLQFLGYGIPAIDAALRICDAGADVGRFIRGVLFPSPRTEAAVRHDGYCFRWHRFARDREFSPTVRFRQVGWSTCRP